VGRREGSREEETRVREVEHCVWAGSIL
jgi:hypothetical protein